MPLATDNVPSGRRSSRSREKYQSALQLLGRSPRRGAQEQPPQQAPRYLKARVADEVKKVSTYSIDACDIENDAYV